MLSWCYCSTILFSLTNKADTSSSIKEVALDENREVDAQTLIPLSRLLHPPDRTAVVSKIGGSRSFSLNQHLLFGEHGPLRHPSHSLNLPRGSHGIVKTDAAVRPPDILLNEIPLAMRASILLASKGTGLVMICYRRGLRVDGR